jgi:carbamate kinase
VLLVPSLGQAQSGPERLLAPTSHIYVHFDGLAAHKAERQQTAFGKPYPFDVLGAETEGMIGYMIEQELGNLLPFERPFATLLTMIEVDPADPAFRDPTKFVGPVYEKADADRLTAGRGWVFRQDGAAWRRVVPSPMPRRIFELRPVKWLLERNTIVIAAGGGGIPTMYEPGADRKLIGVECVIDKDLASGLLAKELDADLFLMLTDADAVYANWGTPAQRPIRRASPEAIGALDFPAGSMRPKVDAACRFALATGKKASIGTAADLGGILAGEAGTTVTTEVAGIVYG